MAYSFSRFCQMLMALGILLGVVGSAPAQEAKGRLTLDEAIETALKQNPAVTEFKEKMNAAREGVGVSRGALFPQISFSSNYLYGNATSITGAPSGLGGPPGVNIPVPKATDLFTSRFSVNQLIYDFGKTTGKVDSSRATFRQTGEDYAGTRQQVVLDARTAYFGYLAARRAVKVEEENVRQNQELLKQAKGFFQVGLRAKIDVTKAEANLYDAESTLIRAKNARDVSRISLMNALGLKTWPYEEVEDVLEVTPKPLTLEELKAQALKQRPEILRNRYQQEGDLASLKVARAGFFPAVSGLAAYGWQGSRDPLDDNWWVGVGVNFPLFEGMSTLYSVRQAKAQLRSTQANAESLVLNVGKEVEQSYLDLQAAWEVIRSTKKSREAAEENLRLAWGRYKAGVGNIIEVTDAQVQFARSDLNHVRALLDYRVVEARLDKAVGRPF